ncbi:hypothetical protein A45J_2524 [hot springs metagenome]|uniref:Uncharacterized protein n=1 Tax=hot springs metagenome TaxID=433727 RepID=A0A5J4L782_9ZZZZ
MKIIAIFLSFVFVFLPVVSKAEMPEVFTNPEMKDKAIIEVFSKDYSNDLFSGTFKGTLTRISHIKTNGEFTIRTIRQGYRYQGKYYQNIDETVYCDDINDLTTCKVVSLYTECTKGNENEDYTKCSTNNSSYKLKHSVKGGQEINIVEMVFINPEKYSFLKICKLISTPEELKQKNIPLETEKRVPHF